MATLGRLVCGSTHMQCIANTTLDHLSSSIDRFSEKSVRYLISEFSEEAQSFGAFCTRVVLENACAALLGRLDPFRLLYLSEFQAQGGFEYGRVAKSGFRWSGDVFSDDKPIRELWNSDQEVSKISRALFSPHVDHVFWRPAVERALDFFATQTESDTLELRQIDPDNFTNSMKGRCATLYSTLSKGVHWEFFVSSIIIDEATVKESIRECMTTLSIISLVSHFVPTGYRSLEPKEALDEYNEFRSSINER